MAIQSGGQVGSIDPQRQPRTRVREDGGRRVASLRTRAVLCCWALLSACSSGEKPQAAVTVVTVDAAVPEGKDMGSQGLADAGSGESGAAAGAVSAPDATAPGASNGNGLPDAGLSPAPTDEESTADAGSPYDSLGTGSGDGFGAWLNEAGCPSGGTFWPRSHDGLAECHQPVTLDVRAGGVGSVFVAQLSGEQFVLSAPVSEACGTLAGHAAVQLLVPDGVDVEFGVDGAADQDWVLVLSDIAQGAAEPGDTVGCDDTTAVRCIDARLSDGCEWQRLVAGEDFVLGAVSLLLAGRAEVGVTSTLRLRLVAPAGAGG